MKLHELMRDLREPAATKIVLVVADGLGGLPMESGGKTELETARTPNMDALTREGICGLSIPVLPGITPGSGPGHLGLFGYDPLEYRIGRGILEALGINFQVGPKDVAVRGNFCTVDEKGLITDRRAGRPTTERCVAMCELLRQVQVPGVEVFVEPVREHRFVVVFRGDDLGDQVNDTDPQQLGVTPLQAVGADPASQNTARVVNTFIAEAGKKLKGEAPTNMITLRGFARYPGIDTMQEVYGLRSACIAVYPMYKGLARLVGMDVLDAGSSLTEQVDTLKKVWDQYDFFFLHYKYTDSTGEDGNFDAKVEMIERLDGEMPRIRGLHPDVLIVTGDHSTPSRMKSHSWHPVPVLLWGKNCRADGVVEFGESYCLRGGLGQFQAKYLMSLAMAHAGRLSKYGPDVPASLSQALHERRPLLMEGAMGTSLLAQGVSPADCLEARNLSHPELIAGIHRAYRAAGAEVFLTNTFQAHRTHLARFGAADRLEDIVRSGIRLARQACGDDGFVLAALGPTPKPEDAARFLALADGADGLLFETLSDWVDWDQPNNAGALPVLVSFAFVRTPQGLRTSTGRIPEACASWAEAGRRIGIAAVGANCGRDIGMDDMVEILGRYRAVTELPLFARPNAGTPAAPNGGGLRYHLSPADFAVGGRKLRAAGAGLVGGCCGTTAAHIGRLHGCWF